MSDDLMELMERILALHEQNAAGYWTCMAILPNGEGGTSEEEVILGEEMQELLNEMATQIEEWNSN